MPVFDLLEIVNNSKNLTLLHKSNLRIGDCVILKTSNSIYSIKVLGEGEYLVSGGWFDKRNLSPAKTMIHGCTWGGSIIKTDIVAACGLQIEFGNKVVTSKITKFFHLPGYLFN